MGFWEFADRHAALVVFGFLAAMFMMLPVVAMLCDVFKNDKKYEDDEI